MAEHTAADSFFNFDEAAENDLENEDGFGQSKSLYNFLSDLDEQRPQPRSTISTQSIQEAGQRAATSDPSPAPAPLPVGEMQQQWPAPSPISQNMGRGQFIYRESAGPYQPTLQQQQQQQQQVRPQLNVQQHQHAPAPVSANQSMGTIHNTHKKPPAHCIFHTKMYQRKYGPSKEENVALRSPMHQRPLASSSTPNNQQQYAALPPNVEHQKLRSNHRLEQPGDFPTDPFRFPTELATNPARGFHPNPSTIHQHQHQQTANHTPPLTQARPYPYPLSHLTLHQQFTSPLAPPPKTFSPPQNPTKSTTNAPPIKSSKPTGIAKKPLGRKRKDADKTGFINATLPPELHVNTTRYGRGCLRGAGSEKRMAEEWNRPSVRAQKNNNSGSKSQSNNKSESESNGNKSSSSSLAAKQDVVTSTQVLETEQKQAKPRQGPLEARVQRNNDDESREELTKEEGVVNEDIVRAEAAGVEIEMAMGMEVAEEEQEQGPEMTENDEEISEFDIENMDVDAEVNGFDFD